MRHLLKSLFICLVLTSGVIFSLAALTRYSFFSPIINQITLVCILVLLAAIWLAFWGEMHQQKIEEPAQQPQKELQAKKPQPEELPLEKGQPEAPRPEPVTHHEEPVSAPVPGEILFAEQEPALEKTEPVQAALEPEPETAPALQEPLEETVFRPKELPTEPASQNPRAKRTLKKPVSAGETAAQQPAEEKPPAAEKAKRAPAKRTKAATKKTTAEKDEALDEKPKAPAKSTRSTTKKAAAKKSEVLEETPKAPAKSKAAKPKQPPKPEHVDCEDEAFVPLREIVCRVQELIEHDADDDGFMSLAQIGTVLNRLYPDFDSRNYGYSQLHKLIGSLGQFELKCVSVSGGCKNMLVRNR